MSGIAVVTTRKMKQGYPLTVSSILLLYKIVCGVHCINYKVNKKLNARPMLEISVVLFADKVFVDRSSFGIGMPRFFILKLDTTVVVVHNCDASLNILVSV